MSHHSFGLRIVRCLARAVALAYPKTFRVEHHGAFSGRHRMTAT